MKPITRGQGYELCDRLEAKGIGMEELQNLLSNQEMFEKVVQVIRGKELALYVDESHELYSRLQLKGIGKEKFLSFSFPITFNVSRLYNS